MNYTESQLRAIRHRAGNLLVIACAGSGKTEVISLRIAQMVNEGTSRDSIIAFTFTERAARELKARIRRHLERLRPADPSLGDMYVGTIHSL
ncbi:MAG: UvrD-helicase domain-containing protein [Planctomycetota bacterium]